MSAETVIHSNPNITGGTPVFVGTRVPVQTLLDYLEGGESLDTFLDHAVERREGAAGSTECGGSEKQRRPAPHGRSAATAAPPGWRRSGG
jgi:uncharacterized protein DUF433